MRAARKPGTLGAAEVVDALLRAGADETLVDNGGGSASDLIGVRVEEEHRLVEDVERVRELLANVPADRAWRRRGYLVLRRAHSDRVQVNRWVSGTHDCDTIRRARSRGEGGRAGGVPMHATAEKKDGGDLWAVVVTKVLQVEEEGIFRTIVGYL